jgi:hypothetical protein
MLATIQFRIFCSLLSSHLLSRNIKAKIHKTLILPVVLYGCETLRGIFGPKRDKVMEQCKKLHSGKLNNLYSTLNIIRQIKSQGFGRKALRKETTQKTWILDRLAGRVWSGFTWLRIGTHSGLLWIQ